MHAKVVGQVQAGVAADVDVDVDALVVGFDWLDLLHNSISKSVSRAKEK